MFKKKKKFPDGQETGHSTAKECSAVLTGAALEVISSMGDAVTSDSESPASVSF